MKVIFCKGNEGRTDYCQEWTSEAHDRIRISVEEVNEMLNADFPRDSFAIALASCVNMLTNALIKGFDVIIDNDCTNSKTRSRMESVCRRVGADIEYKEFNQSECALPIDHSSD